MKLSSKQQSMFATLTISSTSAFLAWMGDLARFYWHPTPDLFNALSSTAPLSFLHPIVERYFVYPMYGNENSSREFPVIGACYSAGIGEKN
ncbi:hypothetical protein EJ05DRAFT_471480, partial [Pseudovirgaria hyperparasitica]